jgi:hypothetical protein
MKSMRFDCWCAVAALFAGCVSGLSDAVKSVILVEAVRRGYDTSNLIWVKHGKERGY